MSAFQSAREFFGAAAADPDDLEERETPLAKSILWYDARTPVFTCCEHAELLAPLRWAGDGDRPENYDEYRQQVYTWLFEADPECDACAGRLREVIGR